MAWFFGSKNNEEEDEEYGDEEYDSGEEEYDDEEYRDQSSFEGDEVDVLTDQPAQLQQSKDTINMDDKVSEAPDEAPSKTKPNWALPQKSSNPVASNEPDDLAQDEEVLVGTIPEKVFGANRSRLPSALSMGDDTNESQHEEDESEEISHDQPNDHDRSSDDPEHKEEQINEEEATTLEEKQSILMLAAEHDRVDILQAILAAHPSSATPSTEDERETLLHPTSTIPPLHIAASHGSVAATTCLLRMGADPSIRPDVAALRLHLASQGDGATAVPNLNRYDDASAWELVFGTEGATRRPSSRWSLFGSSSSNLVSDDDAASSASDKEDDGALDGNNSQRGASARRRKAIMPADMPATKREGIRHAFTAEALRAIGGDEVDRLRQLINAGMPPSIDIGGQSLRHWSTEMNATNCLTMIQELLEPTSEARTSTGEGTSEAGNADVAPGASAVLDRSSKIDQSEVSLLSNRLDELESLGRALSACADNLGEEVNVSHGLLVLGGGATALASHVRSLKALRERRLEELQQMQEYVEDGEEELQYWIQEGGPEAQRLADQISSSSPAILLADLLRTSKGGNASDSVEISEVLPKPVVVANENLLETTPSEENPQKEEIPRQKVQLLQAQIAASEMKIRKLRVMIADLSEEKERNLAAVEQRGLTGGIRLVSNLREEIREIEYELSELQNAGAMCRTKVRLIQTSVLGMRPPQEASNVSGDNCDEEAILDPVTAKTSNGSHRATSQTDKEDKLDESGQKTNHSVHRPIPGSRSRRNNGSMKKIAETSPSSVRGDRENYGGEDRGSGVGFLSIWDIILRIIGLRDERATNQSPPAAGSRSESASRRDEMNSPPRTTSGNQGLQPSSIPISQHSYPAMIV
jgi:hypothetical protein